MQMLLDSQIEEQGILLRTVPNLMPHLIEVLSHIPTLNGDGPTCRRNNVGQTFECRTLSSSIDTKQRKALTLINSEWRLLNGKDWLTKGNPIDLSELVDSHIAIFAPRLHSLLLLVDIFIHLYLILRFRFGKFPAGDERLVQASSTIFYENHDK